MNDNNDKNEEVTPYRASGNLNTYIGIPQIDVNDPMNVNIQNVNTNNTNTVPLNNISGNLDSNDNTSSVSVNTNDNDNDVKKDDNIVVNKTYVGNSNNKKKKVAIKLGPEFKIAFLIIVVLLTFVFLLPVIASLFNK